jgi:cytochrome oxidase Cu insertion factor (SCO1/SenC/PrrC family)
MPPANHSEQRRTNPRAGRIFRVCSLAAALAWLSGTTTLLADASANSARTPDHDYDPPVPGSYTLPVIKPAADGEVLEDTGRPRRLFELTRGRVTVMSFIYTRCAAAKACPYATGVLMQLHQLSAQDQSLAAGMRLISMSFDPTTDTPERMAGYSKLAQTDRPAAEWRFLTTASPARLKPILDAYGQAVDAKQNPLDPTGPLYHTLRVFLIDPQGRIRNIYSSGTLDLRLVLADVRTLMMEQPGSNHGS